MNQASNQQKVLVTVDNFSVRDFKKGKAFSVSNDIRLIINAEDSAFQTDLSRSNSAEVFFKDQFSFAVLIASPEHRKMVSIEIWSESSLSKRRFLGQGKVSFEPLLRKDYGRYHNFETIIAQTNYLTGYVKKQCVVVFRAVSMEPKGSGLVLVSSPQLKRSQELLRKSAVTSPYELIISVHGADYLPSSENNGCDPYVVVHLDEVPIGKTNILTANPNPRWGRNGMGDTFYAYALHCNKTVSFHIYDAHLKSYDQYIGHVMLPLSGLNVGDSGIMRYPVNIVGDHESSSQSEQSILEIGIEVLRNDSLVRIVGEKNRRISITTARSEEYFQTAVDMLRSACSSSSRMLAEAVTATLHDFLTDELIRFVDRDLLRDLAQDLRGLNRVDDSSMISLSSSSSSSSLSSSSAMQVPSHNEMSLFKRNKLRILNGRKIDLSTREESRFPPIQADSLQLNLSADGSRFVVLQLANRLSAWTWTKWLFLLHDYWRNQIGEIQLPAWAESGEYYGQVSVSSSEGLAISGRGCVSCARPFQIKVNEFSFELAPMISIVLSADSERPKAYILDLEILSEHQATTTQDTLAINETISVDVVKDTPKEDASIKGETASVASPSAEVKSHRGIMRSVMGAMKGASGVASTVVTGVMDVGKEVASGMASTTVHAARTIAIGPMTAIVAAQDTVLEATSDIATLISTAPRSVLAATHSFVVIQCDGQLHVSEWGRRLFIDLDDDSNFHSAVTKIDSDSTSTSNSSSGDGSSGSNEYLQFYPSLHTSTQSLCMFLLKGSEGIEKIAAQKSVSIHKLLRNKNKKVVASDSPPKRPSISGDLEYEFDFAMDASLGLGVAVVEGCELRIPPIFQASPDNHKVYNTIDSVFNSVSSVVGSSSSSQNLYTLYAKCKLVDENGHSYHRVTSEQKTGHTVLSPNPKWSGNNHVIFKASEDLAKCSFVRVEIIASASNNVATSVPIGAAFIPLKYFGKTEKKYTFPVSRSRRSLVDYAAESSSLSAMDRSRRTAFGTLTVQIKLIEEQAENATTIVRMRSALLARNIFNCAWYCEAIPAGGVELVNRSAKSELYSVYPGVDGLLFLDFDDHVSGKEVRVHGQPIIEVEVFENERRFLTSTSSWTKNTLTRPAFSDLSYARDFKFTSLSTAKPPAGFTWESDWVVDKKYTHTDKNGWSYGPSFGRMLLDLQQNKSSAISKDNSVRRRKWTRKAIRNKLDSSTSGSSDGIKELSQSSSNHEPVTINDWMMIWRNAEIDNGETGILRLCEERESPESSLLISWNQILSVTQITSSVLSVVLKVRRFLKSEDLKSSSFKPAEVEIFISNCPAAELAGLIEERSWCHRKRTSIEHVIKSGSLSPKDQHWKRKNELECDLDDSGGGGGGGDDAESVQSENNDGVPETEDLSLGAQLMSELDSNSLQLDVRTKELRDIYLQHNDPTVYEEMTVLVRRNLRLRLYMAALLGASLEGDHSFNDSEVRRLIESDVQKCHNIDLDGDVATANNRVEYLLDTAEQRVRDTALCGWEYRGGVLERCLELLVNGYFIEIINQLAIFFESNKLQTIKGLSSKVELISAFMKHNDRLSVILTSTLRLYHLQVSPSPQLSLFLDMEVIQQWYSFSIYNEMKMRVDNTLDVYKNVFNDASGLADRFHYPLPWVPGRPGGDSGPFSTTIVGDVMEILSNYLEFARISKEEVPETFHPVVDQFDQMLIVSYISSFVYLAEAFTSALTAKEWMDCGTAELDEYMEFLCSVSNDACNVQSSSIFKSNDHHQSTTEATDDFVRSNSVSTMALEVRMNDSFKRVQTEAVEQLSCVMLSFLFCNRQQLLQKDVCKIWLSSVRGEKKPVVVVVVVSDAADEDRPNSNLIPGLMRDLTDLLIGRVEFLKFSCFIDLLRILADKLVLYLYSLIDSMHTFRQSLHLGKNESELMQIHFDIMSAKKCLATVAMRLSSLHSQDQDHEALQKMLLDRFQLLDYTYTLLSEPAMSHPFVEALQMLQTIADREQSRAAAIVRIIEVCMDLRGVNLLQQYPQQPRSATTTESEVDSPAASTPEKQQPRRFRMYEMVKGMALFQPETPPPQDDLAELNRMKSEMLVQWVNRALTHVRGVAASLPVETSDERTEPPPDVKVFAPRSRRHTIRGHLLQSHIPSAAREFDAVS